MATVGRKQKVIVIGGGVAGLSAAHMLITRGYEVDVYERHCIPGGKARSYGVRNTGKEHRHNLPAEHGFRFIPSYYRHLPETLAEIPYWDSSTSVEDQLVEVQHTSFARFTGTPMVLPSRMPSNLIGYLRLWRQVRAQHPPKLSFSEQWFYASRIWQLLTSCPERRDLEYEQIGWWEYVAAETKSDNYRSYLANLSRTLVAANPHTVSTRTNGNSWLQMILGMWSPNPDRVFRGPTNEIWIHPWLKSLLALGVKYYLNVEAVELPCENRKLSGIKLSSVASNEHYDGVAGTARVLNCDAYGVTEYESVDLDAKVVTGDAYILAVPVERVSRLLVDQDHDRRIESKPDSVRWAAVADEKDGDSALRKVHQLAFSVQNMNGIQFYLKASPGKDKPPDLVGHTVIADSPFALTSIFQRRHWPDIDLSHYGDGSVRNILSVDISDWSIGRGRIYHKPANQLTRTEVKEEVWADIKTAFHQWPAARVDDDNLVDWFLDFDIRDDRQPDDVRQLVSNDEPLLVSSVNTRRLRPEATTGIENLYLAADYVATYTDLATMEGANEAARRAVNAFLDRIGSTESRLTLYPLAEPEIFAPFKAQDRQRFNRGEPWANCFPVTMQLSLAWIFLKSLLGVGK